MRAYQFAAIDIGSNAVRLLVSNVFETGPKVTFKKQSLVRVPIRLGADAFLNHTHSQQQRSSGQYSNGNVKQSIPVTKTGFGLYATTEL